MNGIKTLDLGDIDAIRRDITQLADRYYHEWIASFIVFYLCNLKTGVIKQVYDTKLKQQYSKACVFT